MMTQENNYEIYIFDLFCFFLYFFYYDACLGMVCLQGTENRIFILEGNFLSLF